MKVVLKAECTVKKESVGIKIREDIEKIFNLNLPYITFSTVKMHRITHLNKNKNGNGDKK